MFWLIVTHMTPKNELKIRNIFKKYPEIFVKQLSVSIFVIILCVIFEISSKKSMKMMHNNFNFWKKF